MKTMENLLNCDGRRFRAKIDGVECKGKVRVENNEVFLCQNKKDGAECSDRLGFKYSWAVDDGSMSDLRRNDVAYFELIAPSTPAEIRAYKDWQVGDKVSRGGEMWEVISRSGKLVVCEREDGCASANYTCDELYNDGWRLLAEEDRNVHEKADSCTDAERNVHESGETATYKPKAGDLVYVETYDRSQKFILIYGANKAYAPSLSQGVNSGKGKRFFEEHSRWIYSHIRPATPEEAALFTRILAENGYEYDPEKKEVRKKRERRKRAELAGRFYFINSDLSVSYTCDCRLESDERRYQAGNYFLTLDEAEEVAAKFREILSKL